MAKIIGIDLGTTKCSAAVMMHGEPMIIPNARGNTGTPSVVAFAKDGRILVGEDALSQAVLNVRNTFFNVKRAMGSSQKFDVGGRTLTPQQIVAHLLVAMKRNAETYLGDTVDQAVVSVPAYFNDAQRWFTYNAGHHAGLNVLRVINEATAAGLYYGYSQNQRKSEKVVVYDLGGGSFDVSVLDIGSEGVLEVKAVKGDTHLGGIDFDKRIADRLIDEFAKDYSTINLRDDTIALERIMEASERAKIDLSSTNQVEINIPYITMAVGHMLDLKTILTREKLEGMTSDLIKRTTEMCSSALSDAKLNRQDIEKIILVGRQTRMPAIYRAVTDFFGKEPSRNVDPAEAVVLGAAVQAGVLSGEVKNIILLDVIPLSLGIEVLGGVFNKLIERNTTIPTTNNKIFTTAADGQTDVLIRIFQGEHAMAADNKAIGTLQLTGIPSALKGIPQIEVTFNIEPDGVLYVTAKHSKTGKIVQTKIEDRGNLIKPKLGTVCPYGRWPGETFKRNRFKSIKELFSAQKK